VLPASANKGTAARFLAGHLGIAATRLLVSGDSGNDLALFGPDVRGVVVGNAQPELRAITGKNIFHSTQSYAAGVLDGVQYWLNGEDRAKSAESIPGPTEDRDRL
jgi:hydroxymethylpyrimidine pyrophosphatase-like HAD family hydrolase